MSCHLPVLIWHITKIPTTIWSIVAKHVQVSLPTTCIETRKPKGVLCIAINPVYKVCMAIGFKNGAIYLQRNGDDGDDVLIGHTKPVTCLEWHPSGDYLISGSIDKTIRFWNLDGKCVRILRGHKFAITCIAWVKKTGMITSCSKHEHKLWS